MNHFRVPSLFVVTDMYTNTCRNDGIRTLPIVEVELVTFNLETLGIFNFSLFDFLTF